MKKRFGNYRRLAKGLIGCSSLWEGADHFVYVKGNGILIPFTEEYKRFRFRDIQSITMAQTRMFLWTSLVFGLGAAASAAIVFLPTYGASGQVAVAVLFLPVLAVCLPGFIITVLRGPSCRCRIQTAVGSVPIRPLSRMRSAKPVVDEMGLLVAMHQEKIFADAPFLEEAPVEKPVPAQAPFAMSHPMPQPRKRPWRRSPFLLPTLGLLVFFGLFLFVYAFVQQAWPLGFIGLLSVVLFAGLIVSLVGQLRCATPGSILTVLWTGLVQQIVFMIVAYFVYTFWSFESRFEAVGGALPVSVSGIYGEGPLSGFVYYYSLINGGLSLLLGLAGITSVLRIKPVAKIEGSPPILPVPPAAVPQAEVQERLKRLEDFKNE